MTTNTVGTLIGLGLAVLFVVGAAIIIKSDRYAPKDDVMREQWDEAFEESAKENAYDVARMRQDFRVGCLEEDPTKGDFCDCVFDVTLKDVGKAGLMEMAVDFASGHPSEKTKDVMYRATADCFESY